jgi:hypothetical protein
MNTSAERFRIASRVTKRALDMMGSNRDGAMYDLALLRASLIRWSVEAKEEFKELEETAALVECEDDGTLPATAKLPAMDTDEMARVLGLEDTDAVAIRLPEEINVELLARIVELERELVEAREPKR